MIPDVSKTGQKIRKFIRLGSPLMAVGRKIKFRRPSTASFDGNTVGVPSFTLRTVKGTEISVSVRPLFSKVPCMMVKSTKTFIIDRNTPALVKGT